ncbi:MAG: FGGY-family carbohydrate kinase [Candidatus Humimicrobiaceae bacterium]
MKKEKEKFIIGIDIGTTNIKGAVYSSAGKFISVYNTSYESFSPKPDYHEQNPDDWVDCTVKVLEQLLKEDNIKQNTVALSLSTQGGTIVPVGKDFKPLCNAITWLDRRGNDVLKQNKDLADKNIEFYLKTGWRLDCNMSFLSLYWLKMNKKEVFSSIYKILYVNDYVQNKLTGNSFHDPSNASISLFYNIENNKWDEDILELLGVDEKKFSEVAETGTLIGYLKREICRKLNLKQDIAVINGGHDQYCAALGAGILDKDKILLSTGTAWVIFKMTDKPMFDEKSFFSVGRNIIKDKFGLVYAIPAAGASIKWFAKNLLNLSVEKALFEIEKTSSERIKNSRSNIIFYPYLTGAFGPDFDIEKRASFLNIEIGHDFIDLYKSILEGIGFQLKRILSLLDSKGSSINQIKMIGGASKSKIWPGIIADITETDILVPLNKDEDYAVKGAAIIAGTGAGLFKSLKEGYETLKSEFQIIKPDRKNTSFYREKYKKFLLT